MKRTFQNAGLQSPAAPSARHERAAGPRLPRAASACLPCAPQHLWCVVRVIKKKCDQKNAGKKKRIKENKRRKASACLPCAPQHLSCVVRVIFLFYFYFLYIFYSISGVWCVLLKKKCDQKNVKRKKKENKRKKASACLPCVPQRGKKI